MMTWSHATHDYRITCEPPPLSPLPLAHVDVDPTISAKADRPTIVHILNKDTQTGLAKQYRDCYTNNKQLENICVLSHTDPTRVGVDRKEKVCSRTQPCRPIHLLHGSNPTQSRASEELFFYDHDRYSIRTSDGRFAPKYSVN